MALLVHVSFEAVSAPFFVAAGLLIVAGIAKVREPHGAQRVFEALGLRLRLPLVRLLGLLELAIGIAAVAAGVRWLAILVALLFASFTAVGLWLVLSRVELPSCGCLGALETPPSLVHVAISLLGLGAAGTAAVAAPVRFDIYLGSLPLLGVPFLIAVVAGVAAAALAMAYVPILVSSYTVESRG